jgi:hypothetical protein
MNNNVVNDEFINNDSGNNNFLNIDIDNNYFVLYKTIKLFLNIILNYFFISIILNTNFSTSEKILFIITFNTILFYILDCNFPVCNIIITK